MAPTRVQFKSTVAGIVDPSVTATFDDAPTEDNLLIALFAYRGVGTSHSDPSGWTKVADVQGEVFDGGRMLFYYKFAGAAESSTLAVLCSSADKSLYVEEWSEISGFDFVTQVDDTGAGLTNPSGGTMTAGPGTPSVASGVLFAGWNQSSRLPVNEVQSPFTEDYDYALTPSGPHALFGHQVVASFSGAYSATATTNQYRAYGAFLAAFQGGTVAPSIAASFTGTPTSGVAPLVVQFTDSSSGTPTAWSWNFGDGSAAGTAQNPEHTYTTPGVYTVSLTASKTGGTASFTRTDYITVNSSGVVIGDTFIELPAGDIQSWVIRRGSGAAATGASYTGSATVRLINRANRYNPENESSDIIDALRDGTRIWIGVNEDGTLEPDDNKDVHGLFAGRVTEITVIPTPGTDVPSFVEFVCEDPLAWISRTPVRLSASRHRSHDSLRFDILNDAGETSIDLDDEIMTMPLSYADGDAGGLLEQLNAANGSRHFARPTDNPDTWYEYVSVNRMHNLAGGAQGTVNAGTQHVTDTSGWKTSADTVINQQKATIEPYSFTSYSTLVWALEDVPFPASRRTEMWIDFDDFVDGPIIDLAHTGGTVTASLEDFGTTALLTLTVAGTATINRLEVEGSLTRRQPAESVVIDDEDSQEPPRGVRAGSDISGDFVGTIAAAQGIAEHVVWRYADPKYTPDLTIANWFPNQFALDLYDNIKVTSAHIGVADRIFEIVGLTHEGIRAAESGVVHHVVKYDLLESRVQSATNWFTCDTSTANGTHILGY